MAQPGGHLIDILVDNGSCVTKQLYANSDVAVALLRCHRICHIQNNSCMSIILDGFDEWGRRQVRKSGVDSDQA